MNVRKEKWSYRLCLCFALIFIIVLFGGTSAPQAKKITLRFATYQPPRGIEGEAPKWLMEEITKRTNGQVKFEQYFGGSLLKARELLKGIQAGTADMGFIFTAYYPKELKIHLLPQIFIRGPVDPAKKMEFFESFYKEIPEARAEIEAWNQKRIAIHLFGKMAAGGVKSIKSLDGIKGLKMRVAGGYDALHMKCLGANVVFLRSSDVYSAFQKGAIDAAYSTPASFYRSKWYETAKPFYLFVIPKFSGTYAFITINLDTFRKLPPDIQDTIVQVGKEYNQYEARLLKQLEENYSSEMASKGVIILEESKDGVTNWAEKCEAEAIAKGVREAEKQGLPGEKLMEQLTQLINEYSD
jgi:TRAP-type C4-dicarboxylate transport system substrate-binding protein